MRAVTAFLLYVAVVIGTGVALAFGGPEARGAVVILAGILAIAGFGYMVESVKKHNRRQPRRSICLDCRDGHHRGCCIECETCQELIRRGH